MCMHHTTFGRKLTNYCIEGLEIKIQKILPRTVNAPVVNVKISSHLKVSEKNSLVRFFLMYPWKGIDNI